VLLGLVDTIAEIDRLHRQICDWIKSKPKRAIRSSDRDGTYIRALLKEFGKSFYDLLDNEFKPSFKVAVTKGKSNLPAVLWVALVPQERQVFNSMSLAACFGVDGEGSVLGVMDAVTYPQAWLPKRKRSSDGTLIKVSLNAKGSKFKYDDKFHNPEEFLVDNFDPIRFQDHANLCAKILREEVVKRFPPFTGDTTQFS